MTTDQIDAVNPANIPAAYDGQPAARITVVADQHAQIFDVSDTGNASPAAAASSVAARYARGAWSVCYINQSGEQAMTDALRQDAGMVWTDARYWPMRGAYLWCADPSGNIAAGRWTPPVAPVAVQDRYHGTYDLSTVSGPYSGRVAGYIDGPQSAWPPGAWARFAAIPDVGSPREVLDTMLIGVDPATNNLIVVGAAPASDTRGAGNLLVFEKTAGVWSVTDVTDAIKAGNPADPRAYQVV